MAYQCFDGGGLTVGKAFDREAAALTSGRTSGMPLGHPGSDQSSVDGVNLGQQSPRADMTWPCIAPYDERGRGPSPPRHRVLPRFGLRRPCTGTVLFRGSPLIHPRSPVSHVGDPHEVHLSYPAGCDHVAEQRCLTTPPSTFRRTCSTQW